MRKTQTILKKILIALLQFKALLWLVLGILFFVKTSNSIIFTLLILNSILHLICAYLLAKRKRFYFYLVIGFILANIILTFTDEFGLIDASVLFLDSIILILLFLTKKHLNLIS